MGDSGFCALRHGYAPRCPNAAQLHGKTFIMGRFDSRNTTKMRQRKAQSKKKARAERRAEETRVERQGK